MTTNRRTMLLAKCMVLVAALFTAPLCGAASAQADDAGFVRKAQALGFQQWDDVLIRMGRSACRFLQPHLRRHTFDVAYHIERYAFVESDQAERFLELAVHEYCPDLAYRLSE